MTNKSRALVIIDPQNCFMDQPGMPLPVAGATDDMVRLANHLYRFGFEGWYDSIYVTLDTHPVDHISHAVRWIDIAGNHPAPFTIITPEAYRTGVWRATLASDQAWQGEYLELLKRPHCIWPVHGQKGAYEHQVCPELLRVFYRPSRPGGGNRIDDYANLVFVEKGMHRDTEQFGVFGANVPFPGAPETKINQVLIDEIDTHNEIIFAGEASSHCVMDSVNQFLAHVSEHDWHRVVVLRNCMSPVPQPPGGPDFPALAEAWFADLQTKGIRVMGVADYAATIA